MGVLNRLPERAGRADYAPIDGELGGQGSARLEDDEYPTCRRPENRLQLRQATYGIEWANPRTGRGRGCGEKQVVGASEKSGGRPELSSGLNSLPQIPSRNYLQKEKDSLTENDD